MQYNHPELPFKYLRKYKGEPRQQETRSHGAYKVTVGVIIFVEAFISCRRAFIILLWNFCDFVKVRQGAQRKKRRERESRLYSKFSN